MRALAIARLGSALILSAGDRVLAITNFYIRATITDCGEVGQKFVAAGCGDQHADKRALPGHERDHHSQRHA